MSPFAHTQQAECTGPRPRARFEAPSVVAHSDEEGVAVLDDIHIHAACGRVPRDRAAAVCAAVGGVPNSGEAEPRT